MVIISSCQVKAVRSAKTSHNYSKIYNNTQLGDTTVRNRSFGSSFGNKLALLKLTELPARSICAANSQHKDSSVASPKCSADETKSGTLSFNIFVNYHAKYIPEDQCSFCHLLLAMLWFINYCNIFPSSTASVTSARITHLLKLFLLLQKNMKTAGILSTTLSSARLF